MRQQESNVGIDLRQRRLVVLIILSTLFVSAAFVASGTTRLIANAVLPLDATVATAAAPAPSNPTAAGPRKDPTTILHRNIFDAAQGPLDVEAPPPSDEPGGEDGEPGEAPAAEAIDPNRPPPRCEGTLKLVGSFFARTRPHTSIAAITNAAGKVLLYREGAAVDDKTVHAIGASEVYLRAASGSLCSLAMFTPADAAAPAAEPTAAPPTVIAEASPAAEGDGALSAAELDQGIQRVSDTQYNVSRSLMNRVLENQAQLMSQARVVPQEEGGRTTGVKVYGIRRNSLLSRLGVQNGDVLRSINGYSLTSPDSALEAYTRLRSAEQLTIQMMRRGTPTNVNYSIR